MTYKRSANPDAVKRGMQQIHAEGQGVWRVMLCSPATITGLLIDVADGDYLAKLFLRAITDSLEAIATAAPDNRLMCLTCEAEFGPADFPTVFVFITGHRDDPSMGVCNGLCDACYERNKGPGLAEHITKFYRDNIINDLRVLPPISPPGRA